MVVIVIACYTTRLLLKYLHTLPVPIKGYSAAGFSMLSGLVKESSRHPLICDGLSENQGDKVAIGTGLILTTQEAVHQR